MAQVARCRQRFSSAASMFKCFLSALLVRSICLVEHRYRRLSPFEGFGQALFTNMFVSYARESITARGLGLSYSRGSPERGSEAT